MGSAASIPPEEALPEKLSEDSLRELLGGQNLSPDMLEIFNSAKDENGMILKASFIELSSRYIDEHERDCGISPSQQKYITKVSKRVIEIDVEDTFRAEKVAAFKAGKEAAELKILSVSVLDMTNRKSPYVCVSASADQKYLTEPQSCAGNSCSWSEIAYSMVVDHGSVDIGAIHCEVWEKNYVIPDLFIGYAFFPTQALLAGVDTDVVLSSDIMANNVHTGRIVMVARLEVNRKDIRKVIKNFYTVAASKEKSLSLSKADSEEDRARDLNSHLATFNGGTLSISSLALHSTIERMGLLHQDLLDPYCVVTICGETFTTEAQMDAGGHANWGDFTIEKTLTLEQFQNQSGMSVEVWDKNIVVRDEVVSMAFINLHVLETQLNASVVLTGALKAKGKACGIVVTLAKLTPAYVVAEKQRSEAEVAMYAASLMIKNSELARAKFDLTLDIFNAGSGEALLRVLSISVLDLRIKSLFDLDKLDPYVRIVVDETITHCTAVQVDAGESATWTDVGFSALVDHAVVSHGTLKFEIWDKQFMTQDRMVGEVTCSLGMLSSQLNADVVFAADLVPEGCGKVVAVLHLEPMVDERRLANFHADRARLIESQKQFLQERSQK